MRTNQKTQKKPLEHQSYEATENRDFYLGNGCMRGAKTTRKKATKLMAAGGKAKPRSSGKKGLFSKVAKMTRVLQAFKTKKVVHTSIVEEPTSVHLRPIQSSTSGLVCHFSKVNYRHPHVPVVIKSTCAATAAVCIYRVFPRDMVNRTI